MGAVKKLLIEIADDLDIDDIKDPEVLYQYSRMLHNMKNIDERLNTDIRKTEVA